MNTLKTLFLEELADIYDAEQRQVRVLPKLAKAATCDHLKQAMQVHLKETEGHVTTLEKVFKAFGEKPKAKKCEATVGLLEEADEIGVDFKGSPAINAALICAVQKVEHHEIASYGCLHEWAEVLDNPKAAAMLEGILEEEKAANQALTDLARSRSNPEAMGRYEQTGAEPGTADERPVELRRSVRPVGAGSNPAASLLR